MAALDSAAAELASTLTIEEVPAKLRCAQCNKIAIDAVKLPCCDQSICLLCSKSLSEECPVCQHSPLDGSECKPNKSLRMTVKAYVKSEEKKRSVKTAAVVESVETPAPTVDSTPAPVFEEEATELAPVDQASPVPETTTVETVQGVEGEDPEQELDDIEPAVEAEDAEQTTTEQADDQDEEDEDDDDDVVITTERPEEEPQESAISTSNENMNGDMSGNGHDQNGEQMMNGGGNFGFDPSQNNFGGMGFGGMNGFNPMMGMGMPGFPMGMAGMPNMMGMPGMMNMDPSMMFGGGFGGMGDFGPMGMGMGGMGGFGGMNGMNGGGGGSGFGYGPGQGGQGGGYNQNYGNQNQMMNNQNFRNDRGFGGAGRFNGGGNRGFGGRGGRGFNGPMRGGRGGGGYQQQQQYNQGNFGQNQMSQQQQQNDGAMHPDRAVQSRGESSQPGGRRGSPTYEPMKGADGEAQVQRPKTAEDAGTGENTSGPESIAAAGTDDTGAANGEGVAATTEPAEDEVPSQEIAEGEGRKDASREVAKTNGELQSIVVVDDTQAYVDESMPIGAGSNLTNGNSQNGFGYDQSNFGYDNGGRGRGGMRGGRGGTRGRGGNYFNPPGGFSEATELTPVPAPPVNAPSGPKAMREGKPNVGWYSRPPPPAAVPTAPSPQVEQSRTQSGERRPSLDRSRSRSRHRGHKHRQRTPSDGYESEETYRRRKDRKRRERKEREANGAGVDTEVDSGKATGRSRSQSPADGGSRRRSHRDKEDDRSSRSQRERSRERRRRHDRSRSPERAKSDAVDTNGESKSRRKSSRRDDKYDDDVYDEIDKLKDRSRKNSSRREDEYESKDRASHHSSSRHGHRSSKDDGGSNPRERERERDKPSSKPVIEQSDDIGFKIKGSTSGSRTASGMAPPPSKRDRRASAINENTAGSPPKDPYAEERAARHAERVAKEQQRRQSTSLGKRMSRDEDENGELAPKGPKGDVGRSVKKRKERRGGVRYEDELPRD